MRRGSVAALALAALAVPALAQKAERPDVKVGDRWQFVVYYETPSTKPNRAWVISSVTPTGIEGTENGEPLTLTAELNVVESPRQTDSNPRLLRFPLEVGDRWSYAGEFDAFRLESNGSIRGLSGIGSQIEADFSATYWYAPAARAIVKSVSRNPYLGATTVELVGFQLR